jgi:predicted PurR-regulated permease PerM
MPGWRILLWAVLVITALLFIYLVRAILLPFIVSFIIAALLEPTVRRLRLRGMSRGGAVTIVILGFYVVMGGLGVLVTPSITRETQQLTDQVQELTASITRQGASDNFFVRWDPMLQVQQQNTATNQIDAVLEKYSGLLERLGLPTTRREIMEQYVDKNRPQITKAVQGFSNSAFGFLTDLFSHLLLIVIVPILVPLMLTDMDNMRRRGPRWIPPAIRASTMGILGDIGQVFIKYLRGITTVVLIYATVMTVFLWAMGVPSWILLGPLFAGLYLVPYIGNIISALTVFSILGFSGITGGFFHPFGSAWAYATLVTALYLLIGMVFDHLIYPQMVGNSVGLSPVISMFVIFCGGTLFGLPGMLIAFPLAGSVKVILDRLIRVTSVSQEGLKLPSTPLRHRTT